MIVRLSRRTPLLVAAGFFLVLVLHGAAAFAAKPAATDIATLELRDEVAQRHALEREAHMDRNVDLLMSLFADDFVMIDAGEVKRPTRKENRARFDAYFRSVRFRKWDDIAPPAIRISKDGTLATVIVRKEVVLSLDGAPEDDPGERAIFAWMETWERRDGRFMLVAVCSTREEPAPDR